MISVKAWQGSQLQDIHQSKESLTIITEDSGDNTGMQLRTNE